MVAPKDDPKPTAEDMDKYTHIRLVPVLTGPDVAACTKEPAERLSASVDDATCPACLSWQAARVAEVREGR